MKMTTIARRALSAVAVLAIQIVDAGECETIGILRNYTSSEADATASRTTATDAAFAALRQTALTHCGVGRTYNDGRRLWQQGGIDLDRALAHCGSDPDCFAVDYFPDLNRGTAFYCSNTSLLTFQRQTHTITSQTHYYKVKAQTCDNEVECDWTRTIKHNAGSKGEALRSRTTDLRAAFGVIPHTSLENCGTRDRGMDQSISFEAAVAKCASMDKCFALDFYPKQNAGTAYYCTDPALYHYEAKKNSGMHVGLKHVYKVKDRRCSNREQEASRFTESWRTMRCDWSTPRYPARNDNKNSALLLRTSAPAAAFQMLPNSFLTSCGSTDGAHNPILRIDAVAKCAAMEDCFAVDYQPIVNGGTAWFCTDAKDTDIQTGARLRGQATRQHIYKVRGEKCEDQTTVAIPSTASPTPAPPALSRHPRPPVASHVSQLTTSTNSSGSCGLWGFGCSSGLSWYN